MSSTILLTIFSAMLAFQDPADIVVPPTVEVKPGRIVKIQAQTRLEQIQWINLHEDVDLIPSDSGTWIIVCVNPSDKSLTWMRNGQLSYKIAAYGAKIVNTKPVATLPVYVVLTVPVPIPPVPPTPVPPTPVPPTPVPPIPVPPTPDKAPLTQAGLRVLIVYETSQVTPAMSNIISGAKVRDLMASKGFKEDGTTCFRALDKDVSPANDQKWVQDAFARPRSSIPWILISNPSKGGFEGPLPQTPQAVADLITKYAD